MSLLSENLACLGKGLNLSYLALATNRFDEVIAFYGELLGFPVIEEWDRAGARGRRFDLHGLRLEILDNVRERQQMTLGDTKDRLHIVVEVADIDVERQRLKLDAPDAVSVAWGARLFQVRDPDGIPLTFLQWTHDKSQPK